MNKRKKKKKRNSLMTPKVTLLPQVFSLQKHHFSLWPEDKDNQEPVQYRSYLPFLIKISTSVQPDFIHSLWGPAPLTFSLSITLWFPYLGHTVFLLTINSPISSRLINPVWKQTESQKSSKSRGVRQQSKAELSRHRGRDHVLSGASAAKGCALHIYGTCKST